MYLNQSIPILYGTPRLKSSWHAILFSFTSLVLACCLYVSAEIWKVFPYFLLMTLLIAMHGYIALTTTRANVLYIFRYFLVWILIFGTAFVWFAYPGEVFVAPFGLEYQTPGNTRILVLGGYFSLCGSLIGWHTALWRFAYYKYSAFSLTKEHKQYFKVVGIILALGSVLLYVWKAGGIVGGGKTYADGQVGFALKFGVFNVFQYIGVALLLIAGGRNKHIKTSYLVFAIITLIMGMLAGSRADYLPQAFLLIMLGYNPKIVEVFASHRYARMLIWIVLGVVLLMFGYLIATFIAIWRTGVNPEVAIKILMSSRHGTLFNDSYGHKMLYFETGNMMLGGFYSAIVQVKDNITGYLFGKSYLNYLALSPPAFLGLPRPLGLAWLTAINGETMTQGGIFEVAEAYWNFGLVGCFLVSFFISYTFGWLLKRGLKYNNYFFLVWYLVAGFMGFRAVWYQNFSYFRIMTVMLVVYFITVFTAKWFVHNRKLSRFIPKMTYLKIGF